MAPRLQLPLVQMGQRHCVPHSISRNASEKTTPINNGVVDVNLRVGESEPHFESTWHSVSDLEGIQSSRLSQSELAETKAGAAKQLHDCVFRLTCARIAQQQQHTMRVQFWKWL